VAKKRLSSEYCLGCGRRLADAPSFHGKDYRVCSDCAQIMQQADHQDFFKVMKTVSKNLDRVRAEASMKINPEHGKSTWTHALGL
jgi:hypothetical protein